MAAGRRRKNGGRPAPPKPVKSGPAASDNSRAGGFELAEIRRLIRLVQRTGIGELEVSSGGRTVRIAAFSGAPGLVPVTTGGPSAPEGRTGAAEPQGAPPKAENLVAVVSPMVGTFYRAPAPDADPYVDVGDLVEVGQTICIVEAMKLMNEIESEVRGRVAKILVENTQPVEFGQKLFLLEPA